VIVTQYAAPAPGKAAAAPNSATVIAAVPDGASLYVDGKQVPMETPTKSFTTPSLEPGKTYFYNMKAVATRDGKTVSQTKRVEVKAGATVRVLFGELKAEGPAPAPANVVVRLPADARLYINGVVCPLTSSTRSFDTPELQPGKSYYYTMKAELTRDGQTRSESQRVEVLAGKKVTVEFNKLPAEAAAAR
jgi:uncharacterized protein (TIGR03000 family)